MASVAVQCMPHNIMNVASGPAMLSGGFAAGVASYPPQDHLQRHNQPHAPVQGFVSHVQGRPAEKRKRQWSKKRKQQPGSKDHPPSQLAALAVKNRQKTKRHYPHGAKKDGLSRFSWQKRAVTGANTNNRNRLRAGQETPRTVPRAPYNSTVDIMARQKGKKSSPSPCLFSWPLK